MANIDKRIDVLILSAGKGSRIKSQFGNTPKALIEHNGEVALNKVLHPFTKSVDDFKISINVRKDEVDVFKNLGFDLLIEDFPLGNAGAIKLFGANLSDPFIVSHNDVDLRDINAIDFYMEHLQNDSFVTMSVFNTAHEKERGIIVKKYNKVLNFTRERWVNCGFYCVSHKTFDILDDGFQDIDEHMLPRLSSIHQLSCYEYKGFYEDWGR
jgi:NDP-sugar pyrophosphorylase family protein